MYTFKYALDYLLNNLTINCFYGIATIVLSGQLKASTSKLKVDKCLTARYEMQQSWRKDVIQWMC